MRPALFPLAAFAVFSFLSSNSALAQPPVQVADLNTTRYDSGDDFFASELVDFGGTVYFSASDGLHGKELWKTDGTAAGTVRLTDLCPGSCDSFPRNLTVFGSSIVFSADDGSHGFEPWITDGTTAGTHRILDAVPGLSGSTPNFFRALGGKLIYGASDFSAGHEIWTTDGTAAGTQRLVDVRPGPNGSGATPWRVVGSNLFFSADDGIHGPELWATDGTVAGTHLVFDIFPGASGSLPGLTPVPGGLDFFAVLGSRIFFAATDGTSGLELWASDGSAAGTTRVADISPGAADSNPNDFEVLGSTILFRADDGSTGPELWKTDGTGLGTVRVADLNAGTSGSSPYELTAFAGAVFFHADDGVHGRELWRTDGTGPGTTMVADIRTGSGSGLDLFLTPHGLIPIQPTKMLFFADDGTTGNELWATDGTPAGTARVADLNPGALSSDAGGFVGGRELRVVVGGKLYFRAFDGSLAEGRQLYTSDGTAAGTARVKRLVEQRSGVALPYFGRTVEPGQTAALANRLIFAGDNGASGGEPAASDGSVAGTLVLADIRPGTDSPTPGEMTTVSSRVLFRAMEATSNDASLWATDGTPAGTAALTGPVLVQPSSLTAFGGKAYFTGFDASHGAEVWTSDGTPGGTGLAFDLVPGTIGSVPTYFTPVGANLFFTAGDTAAGNELWITDGATAHRVADIHPGPVESFPAQLTASSNSTLGPVVFFSADDGTAGRELWVSDGSSGSTHLVADVNPGAGSSMSPFANEAFATSSSPTLATFAQDGALLFAADDGTFGEEPWLSDGTAAGTLRLADVRPGPISSQPRQLTPVGARVVFVADDGVHGRELWAATENPPAATLIADMTPGPGSSVPQHLTSFGSFVLFSADDGTFGRELWVTDGTAQGTRRLADLAPGALPSSPYGFTAVGSDVYLTATDGTKGFEIWRFPRAAIGLGFYPIAPCRAFDNRVGPPLLNGFSQTVTIAGVCGIPSSAKAVAFNLSAITPTGAGFLRAYPSGSSPTLVSQVNFGNGQTRTNNGIVEIGADGKIVVQAALTGGAVSYVFDVVGYFE